MQASHQHDSTLTVRLLSQTGNLGVNLTHSNSKEVKVLAKYTWTAKHIETNSNQDCKVMQVARYYVYNWNGCNVETSASVQLINKQ